ncbi:galactose metabolism- protein [Dimargaris verticillata]|uniref:Galactose metabolism- protein n=1 Tax=Dimargaris verticillata TaxID=2761393 RepID=A0A9W8EBB5_9FUNG|nr:galactose metabolism- protein [Dimargaris verticillata]
MGNNHSHPSSPTTSAVSTGRPSTDTAASRSRPNSRKRHTLQPKSAERPLASLDEAIPPQADSRPGVDLLVTGPNAAAARLGTSSAQPLPIGGGGSAQPRGIRAVSLRYKTGRQSPSLGSPLQHGPVFACESPSNYASSLVEAGLPAEPSALGPQRLAPPPGLDQPWAEPSLEDGEDRVMSSSQTAPRPIRRPSRRTNAVPEFFPATLPTPSVLASRNSVSAGSPAVVQHESRSPLPSGLAKPPASVLPPAAGAAVPTTIQWQGMAESVYMSGSFNDWRHKIRLTPSAQNPALFTATLPLPPGTHFLKFIVDEEWKCDPHLAAAPDDDGNLVNYIRVESPAVPVTKAPPAGAGSRPDDTGPSPSRLSDNYAVHPSDFNASLPKIDGLALDSSLSNSPPGAYTSTIPEHLYHPHHHHHHHHHANAGGPPKPQQPPTLPPHLSNVLLNHSHSHHNAPSQPHVRTFQPEDPSHSVPVPNHVVLNHLFACSIRAGVMAIASTTRYRKKYMTTVYYKPFFSPPSAQ